VDDQESDTVPSELLIPREGGDTDEIAVTKDEVEAAKDIYYHLAGWEESGHPTRAQLEELALGWVAHELGLTSKMAEHRFTQSEISDY
jgi:aldehyde:ferredoxin oxidoreductase